MCEAKPGLRCSTDTRHACADAAAQYRAAHPDGPALDPIASASAAFDASRCHGSAAQARAVLVERHPGVEMWLSEPDAGGYVVLGKIVVPKESRRSGVGTSVMADLVEVADGRGWKLALTPSSEFGASKAGLERFYRRFGFVPNKGRTRDFATRETFVRAPGDGRQAHQPRD